MISRLLPAVFFLCTAALPAADAAAQRAAAAQRCFPLAGTLAGNPYAQAALAKVPELLKGTVPAPSEAEVLKVMPRYTDLRRYAEQTQVLVWAYLTPGTPHAGSPAVLERIVARLDLLTCAMRGGTYFPLFPDKRDNHYNVFLLESFTVSALALAGLEGVPAASLGRWKTFVREGLTFQVEGKEGHESNGEYGVIPNIDLRSMVAFEAGARLLEDPSLHAKAEILLAATKVHLLPGGAFHYFGGSNECFSYHESNLRDLARYVQLSGSSAARDLIAATRDYYPLSIGPGGTVEYATAPSWKAYWNNSGRTVGPQIAAFFSDDPINRGIARAEERRNPGFPEAYLSDLLIATGCYDGGKPVRDQADHVIQVDGNLGGFRARSGRFAASLDARDHRSPVNPIRSLNPSRSNMQGTSLGTATWVGATVAREGGPWGALDSALLRAYGAVQFDRSKPFWMGAATLGSGEPGTAVQAGAWASVAGRYTIGSSKAGPTYVPLPGWEGMEAWCLSQDHLVGYLATEATADTTIDSLTARIALGYGRAGSDLKPKTIEKLGESTWRYGDLVVRVVASTYGEASIDAEAPYFRDEWKKATEIILGAPAGNERLAVTAGTRREAVIEVYPAWSSADPSIALSHEGALVTLSLGQGRTVMYFNSGDKELVPAGQTAAIAPHRQRLVVR